MLVNILSQTTHETGHHMVYQLMGHDPIWGFTKLVQIWDTPPINPDEWIEIRGSEDERGWLKLSSPMVSKAENVIAAAAGPLTGLLGAVLGIVITGRSKKLTWQQIGLAFSLTSSLVAVLYYLRAPIRTGGDEYDIAVQLGVAKSLIEIPLALAFMACLAFGLSKLPSWRIRLVWLGTVLLGSVATGIPMVSGDSLVIAQINAGSPWFQPILGYSLPVFLVNGLTLIGLWRWSRWQDKEVDSTRSGKAPLFPNLSSS
jgi:hypothetical protein